MHWLASWRTTCTYHKGRNRSSNGVGSRCLHRRRRRRRRRRRHRQGTVLLVHRQQHRAEKVEGEVLSILVGVGEEGVQREEQGDG
jgi:hypothetical protein